MNLFKSDGTDYTKHRLSCECGLGDENHIPVGLIEATLVLADSNNKKTCAFHKEQVPVVQSIITAAECSCLPS